MEISGIQGGSAGMASTVSKVSSTAYYDPKDTNQDGVVSAAEEQAYALKHPGLDAQNATPADPYTRQGAVSAVGQTPSASLDLYA